MSSRAVLALSLCVASSVATIAFIACVGEDSRVSDGTSSTSSSSSGSVVVDSSPLDTSTEQPNDAGIGDAEAGVFCERFPSGTTCEDFERGAPELRGWVRDERADGGIEIMSTDGPGGLPSIVARMTLAPHDMVAPLVASARLTQIVTTPGNANAWTLEADVRIKERLAPFGDLSFLGFFYDDTSSKVAALYMTEGLGTGERRAQPFGDIEDGGPLTGPSFLISVNKWTHLVMRIERQASTTKLGVKLDDVELSTISGLPLPGTQHKLNVGPASTTTTGAITLEIDNFVFRTE